MQKKDHQIYKKNIEDKEFIDWQDVFVEAFEHTLILGPELEKETGMFSDGW